MPRGPWGEIIVLRLLQEIVLCSRPSPIASRCVPMPVYDWVSPFGVTDWGLKKSRFAYRMFWGAAWKLVVRVCRGVSVKSAWVKELTDVVLVSLKGKGSVRISSLLSTNSNPSEKETRSGTIGPPNDSLGVADLRPRK